MAKRAAGHTVMNVKNEEGKKINDETLRGISSTIEEVLGKDKF